MNMASLITLQLSQLADLKSYVSELEEWLLDNCDYIRCDRCHRVFNGARSDVAPCCEYGEWLEFCSETCADRRI
jgi:hypothetical protein